MMFDPATRRFTSGNRATLEMFGTINEAEFVGCSPVDLSPERQPDGRASAEKARAMIDAAVREGSHFFEWTHRRINGEEFFANVLLTRMEQGGETVVTATVRDINERKRAEDEIKTILHTTIDGFYLTDIVGRFINTNEAYCQMSGYTRGELLQMAIHDVDVIDTDAVVRERIQWIKKAGHVRFETRHRRKDGSVMDIEASCNFLAGRKAVVCFHARHHRAQAGGTVVAGIRAISAIHLGRAFLAHSDSR